MNGLLFITMKLISVITTFLSFGLLYGQSTFQRVDDFSIGAETKHFVIWAQDTFIYTSGIIFSKGYHPGFYITKYSNKGELLSFTNNISSDTANIVWDYASELYNNSSYRIGIGTYSQETNVKIILYKINNFNNIQRISEYKSLYYSDSINVSKQFIAAGGISHSSDAIYFMTNENCPSSIGLNVVRLVKTDTLGNIIWQKQFSDYNKCGIAQKIIADNSGGIYIAINWQDFCNNTTKIEHLSQINIKHIDKYGNIVKETFSPTDQSKYYIQLIDSLWNGANDFIVDSNNYIIATSQAIELYQPQRHLYIPAIVNLSIDGHINWDVKIESFRNVISDFFRIIKSNSNDGYIVVGESIDSLNSSSNNSALISKISNSGELIWRRYYTYWNESGAPSSFYDITSAKDGGYYIIGESFDLLDTTQAKSKAWLLKVDSFGCLVPGCQTINSINLEIPTVLNALVYPNPISDSNLNLYIGEFASSQSLSICLLDLNGVAIQSWDIVHMLPTTHILKIKNINPGIYLLQIKSEFEIYTTTIVLM